MPRSAQSQRGRNRRQVSRRKGDVNNNEDEIPEVYRELLAEADARDAKEPQRERPVKRRKVGERTSSVRSVELNNAATIQAVSESNPTIDLTTQRQTVYDLDAEDDSDDESDMEWEEVVINQPQTAIQDNKSTVTGGDESLHITLEQPSNQRRTIVRRRQPVFGAEKKLRLDIHKTHILCLLQHVYMRNLWCNDDQVQKYLKPMLTKQLLALLNPRESMHQFSRSTTFIDGLKQVSETFSRRFRVTAPGLRRPYWVENTQECKDRAASIMRDGEIIISKEDFRDQAKTLQGSRDFGAQLFCALLRSAAVETRLVCSLQVLPFSGVAKGTSPEKPKREYIVISSDDNASSNDDRGIGYLDKSLMKGRRLGQPYFKTPVKSLSSSHFARIERPRNYANSPYPVFWVEAFNEAVQKWIPVDPLVTKSVAKPSKFEPPASDRYNVMSYVVAFEEDASARDVTKRYAKAYNAKLRKTRVESTKDGEKWWTDVMAHFEKPFWEDRDQLEISEFTSKSAAEPMPRSIQDFKDHPIYVLERHLRRNEVIHPKRVIGQVEVKKGSLEPVYRRADVHLVRSADGWYRLGRDIKLGEQALKRAPALNQRDGIEDGLPSSETPLYAIHQTELYKPPPVVNGRVPKNVYGNLDVYVPSMIPPGGFHLKHKEGSRAARILGIDYADAVTGFEFRGRHGTAVLNGVIAALEHKEALEEVITAIEDERIQEELDRKTEEALRLWKHFLLKLRIAEKVRSYAFEGEDSEEPEDEQRHLSDNAAQDSDFADAGGFLPEDDNNEYIDNDEDPEVSGGGGFIASEDLRDPLSEPQSIEKHDDSLQHVPPTELSVAPTREKPKRNVPRYKLIVIPKTANHDTTTGSSKDQPQAGHASHRDQNISVVPQRNIQSSPGSSKEQPIQVDSSSTSGHTSASSSVVMTASKVPAESTAQQAHTASPEQSDSDSNIENVSLLSHDPEDEDAEPEWLMSD